MDLACMSDSSFLSPLELREKMNGDIAKLNSGLVILEGMSLLSTYRLEEKNKTYYIYQIKKPLGAYEFFSSKEYVSLLVSKIGERRCKEVSDSFSIKKTVPSEYVDVSASFSDVFDIEPINDDLSKYNGAILSQKAAKKTNGRFSYEELIEELSELSIDKKTVEEYKNEINSLSDLYKIDGKTAGDIIKEKCVSTEGVFSLDTFKSSIKNYYHFHLEDKTDSARLVEIGTSDMAKKVKVFDSTSPIVVMAYLLKIDPPMSYRNMLGRLYTDFHLPGPIINVIIDYVFQKCDASLPENYVYKVASSFPSHKFTSANQAISFLYQNEENRINSKRRKNREYKELVSRAGNNAESGDETKTKQSKSASKDIDLDSILGDDL